MTYLKINGFHTGAAGSRTDGIGKFLNDVDAVGVPFLAYCVGGTASLMDAQQIMKRSSVPHNAIFRQDRFPHNQGGGDVPDYNKPPKQAAQEQWESHVARWPKELDPALIWGETVNELRKEVEWADWIGEFCYETGLLALRDARKWCGPGYSAGTPDEGAWETPGMLKFLRLCAEHPDQVAVALHEYSLEPEEIWHNEGYHIGRFEQLIEVCERRKIKPPTIFFTEWGWGERAIPKSKSAALNQIMEVGELYAKYPSIKGAAIWALDGGWGGLAEQVHALMEPLTDLLTNVRYEDVTAVEPTPTEPTAPVEGYPGAPREQYKRRYLVAPPDATLEEWLELAKVAYAKRTTMGGSYDDAGVGALTDKTAVLYDILPERQQEFRDWYAQHYPGTKVEFAALRPSAPEPPVSVTPAEFALSHWPTEYTTITQAFGARPEVYQPYGFPGHEGIDIRAPLNSSIFAAAPGTVVKITDKRIDSTPSNYGTYVVVDHGGGWTSLYAHLAPKTAVSVGDTVTAGQKLGTSGNTGNSTGPHLHFTLKKAGWQTPGWPAGYVDPTPYLNALLLPVVTPPTPRKVGVGLHAGADGGLLSERELSEFWALRPDVIKVLSSTGGESVSALAALFPKADVIVRAFLHFGGRAVTPREFFNWTFPDVARSVKAAGRPFWIELHNEPNLYAEGLGAAWHSPAEFSRWYRQVLELYKGALPAHKFLFPGLSPGGSISGVRWDSSVFLDVCATAVGASDGLAVHAYWAGQAGWPMSKTVNEQLAPLLRRWPGKPVWITEASNNSSGMSPDDKAADYAAFLKTLGLFDNVRGVTFFVASASNPAWNWQDGGSAETWIDVGMAGRVRARLG
jgi:murein DD-endopeptidase MepM/ murein hydrolase activator NlpD